MADRLKEREKGEEFRYEMEQELRFKAESRRNRRLGEWLAERFGMTAAETEAYAKEVIVSDLEEAGVDDVVRKVMKDIEDRGSAITEDEVRAKLDAFFSVALEQLKKDFKPNSF